MKLFERDEKVLEQLKLDQSTANRVEQIIKECEEQFDDDSESIITNERYAYIANVVKACVKKKKTGISTSDKIDRIVTNRILALPIFALVMFAVYYISIGTVGTMATDWTNDTLVATGSKAGCPAFWRASIVPPGCKG